MQEKREKQRMITALSGLSHKGVGSTRTKAAEQPHKRGKRSESEPRLNDQRCTAQSDQEAEPIPLDRTLPQNKE